MDWIGHSLTEALVLFCWSAQHIFFEEPPRNHWPSAAFVLGIHKEVFTGYMKLPYSSPDWTP